MLSDNANFLYSRHVRLLVCAGYSKLRDKWLGFKILKINRKDNMILLYHIQNNNFWAQI